MEWRKQINEVPCEDMQCLVVKNNQKYIEVLNWNEYHKCWDDYENDDYECDRDKVDYWIPFSELPEIPQ